MSKNEEIGEVRFRTEGQAIEAVRLLDGARLSGSVILVTKDSVSRDGTKVLVRGIPWGVSWQRLKDLFSVAGEVAFAEISIVRGVVRSSSGRIASHWWDDDVIRGRGGGGREEKKEQKRERFLSDHDPVSRKKEGQEKKRGTLSHYDSVSLRGLTRRADLNGSRGVILPPSATAVLTSPRRIAVRLLSGLEVAVKASNLRREGPASRGSGHRIRSRKGGGQRKKKRQKKKRRILSHYDPVSLRGLTRRTDLNGSRGVILPPSATVVLTAPRRIAVRLLSGLEVSVKAFNLRREDPTSGGLCRVHAMDRRTTSSAPGRVSAVRASNHHEDPVSPSGGLDCARLPGDDP